MIRQNVRYSTPAVKTVQYERFRGVDVTSDAMLIDRSRLAVGLNLISDYNGLPERRLGFRTLHNFDGAVNGIYCCDFAGEIGVQYIIHAGVSMYRYDMDTDIATLLITDIGDHKSCGFWFESKQYILTGSEYLVYDGSTMQSVSDVAYVPTIYVNKKPDGSSLVTLEGINLLSSKWCEEFLSDGTSKVYQLAYDNLDDTAIKVEKLVAFESWEEMASSSYTVDRTLGRVTFTTAPPVSPITGHSNIKITASRVFEGYQDKIKKCLISTVFESSTIFVAGSKRGMDYRSGFGDATYFSDLGFSSVGTDATDIMCYLKLGEQQVIVKEDNNQDATIYIRSKAYIDGQMTFITTQGAVGVGAISRYASGNLRDDVLFLSRQGVFAIGSSKITLERTLQPRSYYIDALLTREGNLEGAVATVWEGYYIVSVNGRCYVLDGKQQKSYRSNSSDGSFLYECYHWDNINANCFLEVGGELYFGTSEGKLCKFNTDISGMTKYSDDGAAIVVKMVTKMDDFGSPHLLKTLQKKGSGLIAKPQVRSSFDIYIRTNKDAEPKFIKTGYKDIFDWSDIDFNRISFNSNDNPTTEFFKKKIKNFTALQLVLVADQPNEAFGIHQTFYSYSVNGYAKK